MTRFQFETTNGAYSVNVNISTPSSDHIADYSTQNNSAQTTNSQNNSAQNNSVLNDGAEHSDESRASKTTLIMLNALGVTIKKYDKLIKGLTEKGFTVISADYPNCGENKPHIKRGIDYGYDELVNHFVHQLVEKAKAHTPNNDIVLVGHSLGGHLGTIYSAIYNVPIIGIACGSTHYKCWQGRGRIRIFQAVAVIQALINIYGFLPGNKIGLGEREAKTMMHNWCRIALTNKFDFITQQMDINKGRGLYINILGDDFAPLKATQKLAKLCATSKIVRVKLDDDLKGNQHGVWVKRPDKVIEAISDNLNSI